MKKYSVIALSDPRNESFFYVMKVISEIVFSYEDYLYAHQYNGYDESNEYQIKHMEFDVRDYINEIEEAGSMPGISIIEEFISEEAANRLEMYLINRLGRRNNKKGNLLNLCPGGDYHFQDTNLKNTGEVDFNQICSLYPELERSLNSINKNQEFNLTSL